MKTLFLGAGGTAEGLATARGWQRRQEGREGQSPMAVPKQRELCIPPSLLGEEGTL